MLTKTKSKQGVLGSPDRETPTTSHANAASYFQVSEEQWKEVGLQKSHCYHLFRMPHSYSTLSSIREQGTWTGQLGAVLIRS